MSIQSLKVTVFWLACETCGAQSHEVVDAPMDDGQAIEEAVEFGGWTQGNDLNFYCPDCTHPLGAE